MLLEPPFCRRICETEGENKLNRQNKRTKQLISKAFKNQTQTISLRERYDKRLSTNKAKACDSVSSRMDKLSSTEPAINLTWLDGRKRTFSLSASTAARCSMAFQLLSCFLFPRSSFQASFASSSVVAGRKKPALRQKASHGHERAGTVRHRLLDSSATCRQTADVSPTRSNPPSPTRTCSQPTRRPSTTTIATSRDQLHPEQQRG